MGMTPPHVKEGSVAFQGQELRGLRPHEVAQRRIGLVPQGRRLFASLTVTEHLTMLGRSARRSQWTVARLFELFPRLGERRQHRGHQLSGGERQMLAVARALTLNPELLLMDEPSEGLAPVMVQHLERTVVELRELGYAILLVEQNLYSALAVADEAYILETGSIVHHAPVDALRSDRATMHRFLGV
jgi:branched-chain amino acid transport system ATP-binding protein